MSADENAVAARMARVSDEAVRVAEDVWTEDEPTLAEYELTDRILRAATRQAWADGWAARDDHDWNGLSITPTDCGVSIHPCNGITYDNQRSSTVAALSIGPEDVTYVYTCDCGHWHVGLNE